MKKMILLTSLSLLPLVSPAAGAGNRTIHCRSQSAELVFHTMVHGAIAVGDYTVLNGQRADLPFDRQSAEETVVYYNQGRIFQVEDAGGIAPLQFKLLAQFFGEPTVIETGICEDEI